MTLACGSTLFSLYLITPIEVWIQCSDEVREGLVPLALRRTLLGAAEDPGVLLGIPEQ